MRSAAKSTRSMTPASDGLCRTTARTARVRCSPTSRGRVLRPCSSRSHSWPARPATRYAGRVNRRRSAWLPHPPLRRRRWDAPRGERRARGLRACVLCQAAAGDAPQPLTPGPAEGTILSVEGGAMTTDERIRQRAWLGLPDTARVPRGRVMPGKSIDKYRSGPKVIPRPPVPPPPPPPPEPPPKPPPPQKDR